MTVNDRSQTGHVYLRHYPPVRSRRAGWHLSADTQGCESVADLLGRMGAQGAESYRMVALSAPSERISSVPDFGRPAHHGPTTLRIVYKSSFDYLQLEQEDRRLVITLGCTRLEDLRSAFVEVSDGGGDFAVSPNNWRAGPQLRFWWMPYDNKASLVSKNT